MPVSEPVARQKKHDSVKNTRQNRPIFPENMERIVRPAIGLGFVFIGAGLVQQYCLYDVDAGTRAVIFDKITGIKPNVITEGTHFRIPIVQVPIIMDIRSRPRNISSATGTKDLQMVNITLRTLSRPQEDKLPYIYTNLGVDYDDRILPSIVNLSLIHI